MFCRKKNAPVGSQLMADLPTGRLQVDKPSFLHVGINYFGPLLVTQGRSQVKQYSCIFTCLTVRAVHLEIFHSLTTDSFLNALHKFITQRGALDHIYSENRTNFVEATKILCPAFESGISIKFTTICANKRCSIFPQ